MPKKDKKCPNCGQIIKENEEYCPNCHLFVPENSGDETDKLENSDDNHDVVFHHRIRPSSAQDEETIQNNQNDDSSNNTADVRENEESATKSVSESLDEEQHFDSEISEETESDTVTNSQQKSDSKEKNVPKISQDTVSNAQPIKRQMPRKSKKTLYILSAAVVLIGGGGYAYSSYQKSQEQKVTAQMVASANTDVKSLFLNSEHTFLKKGITKSDFNKAKDALDKIKTQSEFNDMNKLYEQAESIFNNQNDINDLFKKTVLDADNLSLDGAYVKTADATGLKNLDSKDNSAFNKLFNEALTEANKQKELLTKAQNAVAAVFKNNKVTDDATIDKYDSAIDAVKSVKDPDIQKTLNNQLDQVKKSLDEKAMETQKAEEQRKKDAEAANNNQSRSQTNDTVNNSQGARQNGVPSTNGKWGNRQDANIDLSNPAWGWNPGVQDKFINTVVSRGYVVPGGYSLVPKFIENGDGYYDLYATTNSRIFPNSKPEEFPIYVVTVNVKTGWFRGNGPR
ncbi:cell division site-positioning protein MapZ family protein [Vagococcus vulneris]|uniref:Zinc-ribbon domain-containing protein n=1 Tax=Vagococcus vulneris TaxID=1977869 RepID=A0A430A2A4_9ENTE|nr:cell division site-positioning protein MapZ family protein [Vagococcus vulneris]RSU00555.1 hypothetical protein CBF37_00640 [Vagococcus vulneris]